MKTEQNNEDWSLVLTTASLELLQTIITKHSNEHYSVISMFVQCNKQKVQCFRTNVKSKSKKVVILKRSSQVLIPEKSTSVQQNIGTLLLPTPALGSPASVRSKVTLSHCPLGRCSTSSYILAKCTAVLARALLDLRTSKT